MLIVIISMDFNFTRGGILIKRNFLLTKHDFNVVRIVVIILVVHLYNWLALLGAVPVWYTDHWILLIRFPHSSLPKIELLIWTCIIEGMLDVLVRSLWCGSHLLFSWDYFVYALMSPVHKCPITPMTYIRCDRTWVIYLIKIVGYSWCWFYMGEYSIVTGPLQDALTLTFDVMCVLIVNMFIPSIINDRIESRLILKWEQGCSW